MKKAKEQLCGAIVDALDNGTFDNAYEIVFLLARTVQQRQIFEQLHNQVVQVQMSFLPNEGYTGTLCFLTRLTGNRLIPIIF